LFKPRSPINTVPNVKAHPLYQLDIFLDVVLRLKGLSR